MPAKKNTANLSGTIENLLDVEGVLEDNETNSRQQGIVRIYNSNNVKIGEIPVGSSGEFKKRLGYRTSILGGGILVQGRKIVNGQNQSFIRTMKLPGQDQTGLILRVVPYDGLTENGISVENFSRHVREVSTRDGTNGKGTVDALALNPIMYKWNFGEDPKAQVNFREILISKQSSDSTILTHYSQLTAENIKNRILQPNDIGAWFRGKIINPSKVIIVEKYDISQPGTDGAIVVYPSNPTLGNRAGFSDYLPIPSGDGYIDFGVVYLTVNTSGELDNAVTITHEFGHVSGLPGHAETLSQEKTVMRSFVANPPTTPVPPRFADIKTAKVIYEDTYKHGQGDIGPNNMLGLTYVLGLKFLDD